SVPVTPEMIRVFDQWRYASGARRDQLHGELWELYMYACLPKPPVHQWPVIQSPREAEEDGERPEALALWLALADARREARAATDASRRRNGASDQPPVG